MADTHPQEKTSPSLLRRIRDPEDAASWHLFVDIYAPLIYGYLRRKGLQDADAADVGQDVLSQVARSIRTFAYEPERGRFRDWLGAVTRSKLARFLHRKERTAAAEDEQALESAVDGDGDGEWSAEFNARLLQAALARVRPCFEPATWEAFERTWVHGGTAAAVAGALGLPIDAVYVARSRVLKRLREEVLLLAEDVPQLVPLG
jgi:RNA polymerase sigma-70 factor (ECF subfamily)